MVFKEDAITALIQSQTLVRMDGTLGSYMSPKHMLLPHAYFSFKFCELPFSDPPLVAVCLVLDGINRVS
jgi:hypothetical protein